MPSSKEILTKDIPYKNCTDQVQVAIAITSKRLPKRPARPMSEADIMLWELCGQCWKYEPEERVNAQDVVNHISEFQRIAEEDPGTTLTSTNRASDLR